MIKSNLKKLVVFGAGKIGRSFIGQLFSAGGFEVVFVDVYKPIIEELNKKNQYKMIIKSGEGENELIIRNVRGIWFSEEEEIASEIAEADILAVSVGVYGLKSVFPLISKGLLIREKYFGKFPLDIVIAENMRNAAEYFHSELNELLPKEYHLNELVGLVETSIGKMVPLMLKKDVEDDILQVFAEPYNELILDKNGFKNIIPEIEGLSPKENMKAWVDRKLFIHNLGHATAAYLGYLFNPDFIYLWEALAVPEINKSVRATMVQSANILLKLYPDDFNMDMLMNHIDDLLCRFANKHLGDTIYRVGCDLKRKLGPKDRLVGAVRLSQDFQMPCHHILFAIACACRFNASDENGKRFPLDLEFDKEYSGNAKRIMMEVSEFNETHDKNIIQCVLDLVDKIDKGSFNKLL